MDSDLRQVPWTPEAVSRLQAMWREGVSPELISQALRRPEEAVRAKASELGLEKQPVRAPG